jgi:hypothetical protein
LGWVTKGDGLLIHDFYNAKNTHDKKNAKLYYYVKVWFLVLYMHKVHAKLVHVFSFDILERLLCKDAHVELKTCNINTISLPYMMIIL